MTSNWTQDLLSFRKEATDEFGAATLDKAIVTWSCSKCDAVTYDKTLRTIAHVDYSDLDSLTGFALDLGKRLAAETPSPPCEGCGAETSLAFDLHSFHAGVRRDIVVRVRRTTGWFSRWKAENYWWCPEAGLEPIQALSPAEALDLQLSALVRRVALAPMLQDPGLDELVAQAERALATTPGNPLLMEVARALIGFGRTGLAGAIAEAHIAAHPDDPTGHFTLGQVIFHVVNHGAMPGEAISEAISHVEAGLALDPSSVEGSLALASCRRFQHRDDDARVLYARVLEGQPGCAIAHYNLGIMALEKDPNSALTHFELGEKSEPDDPDYPMGVARACIALGRFEMAREALNRVRGLAPDHPLLGVVEPQLAWD